MVKYPLFTTNTVYHDILRAGALQTSGAIKIFSPLPFKHLESATDPQQGLEQVLHLVLTSIPPGFVDNTIYLRNLPGIYNAILL